MSESKQEGRLDVYTISKGLSDLAVRNFKRDHPDFDIATIYPALIFSPFGFGQVYDSPATGSNRHIYALIAGASGRPVRSYDPATGLLPVSVDFRNGALKLPPSSLSQKWFIESADTFTWKDVPSNFSPRRDRNSRNVCR